MNERIKELMKQASIYDGRESLYWCSEDNLNKFAQLIVSECAELVEYNSKGAGRDIREHFGIEE